MLLRIFEMLRVSWWNNGVYGIRHVESGKLYVGSTTCVGGFRERFRLHTKSLKAGKHSNKYLQNAWNKHGAIAFEFFIIEETTGRTVFGQRTVLDE
jgi:GIY-YIG catalytic domain